MKIVECFSVDENNHIDIKVPETKINYYYEPIEALTKFDEILVVLVEFEEKQEIATGFEMIDIVLEDLRDACLRILNKKAVLPESLKVGTLGYQYNITVHNEQDTSVYHNFFVWSGRLMPTFLYEKNEIIYLEISPFYAWYYVSAQAGEKFITFENFLESYNSKVIKISGIDVIKEWLSSCEEILNTININHFFRADNATES